MLFSVKKKYNNVFVYCTWSRDQKNIDGKELKGGMFWDNFNSLIALKSRALLKYGVGGVVKKKKNYDSNPCKRLMKNVCCFFYFYLSLYSCFV